MWAKMARILTEGVGKNDGGIVGSVLLVRQGVGTNFGFDQKSFKRRFSSKTFSETSSLSKLWYEVIPLNLNA